MAMVGSSVGPMTTPVIWFDFLTIPSLSFILLGYPFSSNRCLVFTVKEKASLFYHPGYLLQNWLIAW